MSRAHRRSVYALGDSLRARAAEAVRQGAFDAAFTVGASVEGVLTTARNLGLLDVPSVARTVMVRARLVGFYLASREGRCDLLAEYFRGRVYSVYDLFDVDDAQPDEEDDEEDEGPCLH